MPQPEDEITYHDGVDPEMGKEVLTNVSEDGKQIKTYTPTQNFYWLNGLQEYLEHSKHHQMETFYDIKKAVMHGNIWKIKKRIIAEVQRGFIADNDGPGASPYSIEFINILLAHYSGWKWAKHRKIARYLAHCIDDEFIRKVSSWCIKWEERANLNDNFSRGQMRSKLWMIDELKNIVIDDSGLDYRPKLGTIVQYGGWYATIAQLFFKNFDVKKYVSLELDPMCVQMADDFNYIQHQNQWQFKSVLKDVNEIEYDDENSFIVGTRNLEGKNVEIWLQPNLIINTSCEHMDDSWFERLPDGMLVCLQTNDYFSNEQHINCVKNVREAKKKYPMRTIYYEGELDTELYNRFMLIGKK